MKVILKGIRPYKPKFDEELNNDFFYYKNLLEQVPYPLETVADDEPPHLVDLSQYITDSEYPEDSQDWGLTWFDYEEIKD